MPDLHVDPCPQPQPTQPPDLTLHGDVPAAPRAPREAEEPLPPPVPPIDLTLPGIIANRGLAVNGELVLQPMPSLGTSDRFDGTPESHHSSDRADGALTDRMTPAPVDDTPPPTAEERRRSTESIEEAIRRDIPQPH